MSRKNIQYREVQSRNKTYSNFLQKPRPTYIESFKSAKRASTSTEQEEEEDNYTEKVEHINFRFNVNLVHMN
jgi:hypothetical protein